MLKAGVNYTVYPEGLQDFWGTSFTGDVSVSLDNGRPKISVTGKKDNFNLIFTPAAWAAIAAYLNTELKLKGLI